MSGTPASGGRTSVTTATAIGTRGDFEIFKRSIQKSTIHFRIDFLLFHARVNVFWGNLFFTKLS